MKIIHIGRNFQKHAIGNGEVAFTVYSKPDSSLLKDGKPFFIPDFAQEIEYELNLVYRINRLGKNISERFAYRYYDAVTLGVTLKDVALYRDLIDQKEPLELATGFDGSSILGTFVDKERIGTDNIVTRLEVDLHIHRMESKDMNSSIEQIISYLSKFYTLKIGDLIYIGESEDAIGALHLGQNFKGFLNGEEVLSFKVC